MQDNKNFNPSAKDGFNFLAGICGMHSMTVAVFLRRGIGAELLNRRGGLAILLLVAAAVLTAEPALWCYLGAFLLALMVQRGNTAALQRQGERIHSRSVGRPGLAMLLTRNERTARTVFEPLLLLGAGVVLGVLAQEWQMPGLLAVAGWLWLGIWTMTFDQALIDALADKRVQAMRDAQIENEQLMERFRERER
jgi:hypothetical protein